ncbi:MULTISPECIES: hypothetical protein [unclassified Anabaena]
MPNDFFINTESVQVEPDKVVMKTANRTRLDQPESANIDVSCDHKDD